MLGPHVIRRFAGLFGSSNALEAPEGAADIADNVVIRSPDVLEPRRGYSAVAGTTPINALAFKQGKAIALTWDAGGVTGLVRSCDLTTGVFTTFPMYPGGFPFTQPGGSAAARTRFMSAQKSLYWQGRYGLVKIEDVASGVSRAALQPANVALGNFELPIFGTIGQTITVGRPATVYWLATGFQVGYRITLCRKGANGELIESEPSDRLIVSNTTGLPAYVLLNQEQTYMVPSDAFFRCYRSKQVANGTDPSDEMYLVSETQTSGALDSSGYRDHGVSPFCSDQTPDGSLYLPLYSNLTSGSAPGRPFSPAPLSKDLFAFKTRAYYLNTSDVQRLTLKIIGTDTGGIVAGDWIQINNTRFTFTSSTSLSLYSPRVFIAGTVAQNIEMTARQLAANIGSYFQSVDAGPLQGKVFARYISGTSTDAGQIVIQSILPGSDAFTVQTSSANGWGTDYTTAVSSDPNAQAAGLSWSEPGQPEAVPLSNAAQVGDSSNELLRGVAMRDSALLFKKVDGVFKVTDDGSTVGPAVTLFDPSVKLIAPDTLVVIENLAIGLCDQGVLALSESGKANISHDQIERELFKLIAYVGQDVVSRLAFAVANEREHQYILALPESPGAASCTIQYVYSIETRSWSRWTLPGVLCGAVNPDTGQIVWGLASGALWVERRNGDSTDYQDPGFALTCPASTAVASMVFAGDLRRESGTATPVDVGDLFQQPQATYFLQQRVTAVAYASGSNQTTVTLDAVPTHPWQAASMTVIKGIRALLRFLPIRADDSGGPAQDKSWAGLYLAFRYFDADFLQVGFGSEKYSPEINTEQIVGTAEGSPVQAATWAPATWGTGVWGRKTRDVLLRCSQPPNFKNAAQLTVTLALQNALTRWELSALDAKVAATSDRVVK
jgi:hypothetical protein